MPAFRSTAFAGALGALLLAGCATYPGVTYYDSGDSVGGDYSYGERRDDGGWRGGYWSSGWSSPYSSVFHPPYWRTYDPWYTPGWRYYGDRHWTGSGWYSGWSGLAYDPWWGGWYAPYRHGWYDSHRYGGGYRHDSRRAWREHEYRYGRRGYEDWRRSGGDRRASEEAERIARRTGADRASLAPLPAAAPWRGGEPSAYERRGQDAARPGRPSRFGHPEAAPARADDRGQVRRGDEGLAGRRESGWIVPAPAGGERPGRRALPERHGDDSPRDDGRGTAYGTTTWRDGGRDAGGDSRRTWSTRSGEWRNDGYRRIGTPQDAGGESPARRGARGWGDVPAADAGAGDPSRFDRREYSRGMPAGRYALPERYGAPERNEAPARYEPPARQSSARFDPPPRRDDDGGSSSRQLERIIRDDD